MGREVRRVPKDWQHPRYTKKTAPYPQSVGRYIPLFDGSKLADRVREWDEGAAQWALGLVESYDNYPATSWKPRDASVTSETYAAYAGERPDPADYTPAWPDAERTHLMMYEDTSEGTPISPAFETPEELARWLTDNEASAFGGMGASYEGWLKVCRGRPSVGMVMTVPADGSPGIMMRCAERTSGE
jgi:hypothetical protein